MNKYITNPLGFFFFFEVIYKGLSRRPVEGCNFVDNIKEDLFFQKLFGVLLSPEHL